MTKFLLELHELLGQIRLILTPESSGLDLARRLHSSLAFILHARFHPSSSTLGNNGFFGERRSRLQLRLFCVGQGELLTILMVRRWFVVENGLTLKRSRDFFWIVGVAKRDEILPEGPRSGSTFKRLEGLSSCVWTFGSMNCLTFFLIQKR